MKKIIIILLIFIVVLCILLYNFNSIALDKQKVAEENAEFEQFLNKEIYGIDIASIINKAVDKNIKNGIKKDDKDFFIQNDENSIEIEVYLTEGDDIYKMEQIYKLGTEQFVQFFIDAKFKSTDVQYHDKTGRIKYILFEKI